MNPRQRRGTLLLIVSALGAISVFVMIMGYVGSVEAEVGARKTVLKLARDIKAHEPIDAASLERTEVPSRWWSGTFVTSPQQVAGKVAAADLPRGAYLQKGMTVNAPLLEPGKREIAILIDAETGVAGKVRPGMRVDIYATFKDVRKEGEQACAARLIRNTQVIHVGGIVPGRNADKVKPTTAVPITFALSTEEALQLTRAESYATQVRLALIGGRGETAPPKTKPVCQIPAEG